MVDIGLSFFLLAKILIVFVLFYIFVPALVVKYNKEDNSFIDVVFISFIHAMLATIIIVHFLSFLKIYDTFSLIISFLVLIFATISISRRYQGKMSAEIRTGIMVSLIKFVDNETNYSVRFKNWRKNTGQKLRTMMKNAGASVRQNPLRFIVIFLVLATAGYIMFGQATYHVFYGESDCYVHLAWSKYIGSNSMYQDGIYPYGYEAIISALNKLSFIDSYSIVRFLGPIQGLMIILSMYYFLRKNNKKGTMLIWTALFVFVVGSSLPVDITRQISALPQEFASIFLLPGLYFFNSYMNSKKRKYLFYSAECLCITLLVHPYVTAFLVLGFAVTFIVNISFMKDIKEFFKMVGIMAAASVIGVLPIVIGVIMKIPFHSSFAYIVSAAKLPNAEATASLDPNRFVLLFMIGGGAIFLLGLVYIVRLKNLKDRQLMRSYVIVIILSLIMFLLWKAPVLNLPIIMDPNRIGIFFSIFAILDIAIFIELLCLLVKNNKLNITVQFLCFVLVAYTLYSIGTVALPAPNQYEYDAAGSAYLNIKRDYPTFNWTIVSPVEQYQEVLGYGWHYNLFEFVLDFENSKKKKITIPTDYVFIYVEKIPLGFTQPVTVEDSLKSLPPPPPKLSDYYTVPSTRRILEAKMYFYMEKLASKIENINVYYEDEYMKIYMLKQNSKKPVNLKMN